MRFWTLNKLIILILLGAFVALLLEIRSEHQEILGRHVIGWTPVVYSGLMIVVGVLGLIFWQGWGRQVIIWAFAVGLIVGILGFWQHNEEDFGKRIAYVFTVWGQSTEKRRPAETAERRDSTEGASGATQEPNSTGRLSDRAPVVPPLFAPLTFAGLGLIGMLASAARFERERVPEIQDEK